MSDDQLAPALWRGPLEIVIQMAKLHASLRRKSKILSLLGAALVLKSQCWGPAARYTQPLISDPFTVISPVQKPDSPGTAIASQPTPSSISRKQTSISLSERLKGPIAQNQRNLLPQKLRLGGSAKTRAREEWCVGEFAFRLRGCFGELHR